MVEDGQVRMLMRLMNREKTLEAAAGKAGMTDKTARKYRRLGKLPSQCRVVHDWKTREDAFAEDWPWAQELLENHPGLEAKTLFAALQRERPGQYQDSQLRTFQRRVKRCRIRGWPAPVYPRKKPPQQTEGEEARLSRGLVGPMMPMRNGHVWSAAHFAEMTP